MNEMMQQIEFRQGEVLFREGDPPGAVYIIQRGVVEISSGEGDDKVVLAERSEGDVLGEMALVDNQPRSATAIALSDVRAQVISEQEFSKYISELNPLIAKVFQSLVATIRDMNETQVLLSNILKLRGRVS